MRIFRVEHETRGGHGPYLVPYRYKTDGQNEDYYNLTCLAEDLVSTHNDEDHPAPSHIGYWKVCGFSSLSDLYWWFDGFLDQLWDNGYCVAEFEVPFDKYTYVEGQGQVTFDKNASVRIDNHPIYC